MIKEANLTDQALIKTVCDLMDNPDKLNAMSHAASKAGICDAAKTLCEMAEKISLK